MPTLLAPLLVTITLIVAEITAGIFLQIVQLNAENERAETKVVALTHAVAAHISHDISEHGFDIHQDDSRQYFDALLNDALGRYAAAALLGAAPSGSGAAPRLLGAAGGDAAAPLIEACRFAAQAAAEPGGIGAEDQPRSLRAAGVMCGVQRTPGAPATLLIAMPERTSLDRVSGALWGLLAVTALTGMGGGAWALRVRDEASRRQVEESEALRRRSAELKNRLLMHLSHELRTPLAQSVGFCELLTHEPFGPLGAPQYRDWLQSIVSANDRLGHLIENALDFCRLRDQTPSAPLVPVDLRFEVETQLLMARRSLPIDDIVLINDVVAPPGRVMADETALRRILTVLIDNAVAASPKGGRVRLSSADLGDAVALYVDDDGPGAPAEVMADLGAPFSVAEDVINRVKDGAGLGLAVAHHAAQAMNARLSLSGRARGGTRATLRLPAA